MVASLFRSGWVAPLALLLLVFSSGRMDAQQVRKTYARPAPPPTGGPPSPPLALPTLAPGTIGVLRVPAQSNSSQGFAGSLSGSAGAQPRLGTSPGVSGTSSGFANYSGGSPYSPPTGYFGAAGLPAYNPYSGYGRIPGYGGYPIGFGDYYGYGGLPGPGVFPSPYGGYPTLGGFPAPGAGFPGLGGFGGVPVGFGFAGR